MSKLEIGMYYRYKKMFGKYIKPDLGQPYFTNQNKYGWHEIANYGKFSYNIIDLIQVGDYVNGLRIDKIIMKSSDELCFTYIYANEEYDVYTYKIDEIKSIVTKEQFESMEYKVGDSNE